MSPLLLALALSALPCGVTAEDQPCESTAGVPRGVQCWTNSGGGSGIGGRETKWIDARSQRPEATDSVKVLPPEPWWPGPIPKQTNSSSPTNEPYDGNGECPCVLRFDAERFDKASEWKVGEQTLSMWAYLMLGRGELAFAVTDPGEKRHRWIHSLHGGVQPRFHVEGTRWYATATDGTGEGFFLLGSDAQTGDAWRLQLDYQTSADVVDGGVVLTRERKSVMKPWSSLGPGK